MDTQEKDNRAVLRLSNEESNRLTRECLQTALFLLMDEKEFQKITITELVKRSGVSRMAFYRNYSSKEDIILDISARALSHMESSMNQPEYRQNPYKLLLHFFEEVQKEARSFSILFRADLPQSLTSLVSGMLLGLLPADTPLEKYGSIALQSAFTSIVREWVISGMPETPREMALICVSIYRYRPMRKWWNEDADSEKS